MTTRTLPGFLAGLLCASLLVPAFSAAGAQDPEDEAAAMAEMMQAAERYTQPGKHHELLERFLGNWDVEIQLFMGGQTTPPEKGHAEVSWLMDGRWLQTRLEGSMMGMPMTNFWIMGYDNFKQSYVTTAVNSFDTAMVRMEGDMDPGGKALLMYGTLDEYLTGEHDKMVKNVFRFHSDDEITMEVHDLPIGEKNTKVFEYRFKRKD